MTQIQAVRGMNDWLPTEARKLQAVIQVLAGTADGYGYQPFFTPVIEKTDLFRRSIGDATDIVEKEMYTFADRNGDQLTLRPEGTAGCVRAAVEQGLLYHQIQRFYYYGPMFRHERPQKGRYRQFHQFGLEAFGMDDPCIDAEIIALSAQIFKRLELTQLKLCINSLGDAASRGRYVQALVDYLSPHQDQLDEDSKRRLATNPLRILDSKSEGTRKLLQTAPRILDYLDEASAEHFAGVCAHLDRLGVTYVVEPELVRGLDYYNRTVFEWQMAHESGAQNTVCGGGRYDGLVQQLGGHATFAVGFAIGLERLLALLDPQVLNRLFPQALSLYVACSSSEMRAHALACVEHLRTNCSSLQILLDCGSSGLKNQLKRADKSEAVAALIFADQEWQQGQVIFKPLRQADLSQTSVKVSELAEFLKIRAQQS